MVVRLPRTMAMYVGVLAILSFFSPTPVSALNSTVTYMNAKTMGMGDTRVAGGYSYNGFMDNPALLSRVRHVRFSLMRLPMAFNNHLLDVTNFIYYNNYNFRNFSRLKNEGKEIFLDAVSDYEGEWGFINISPMFDCAVKIRRHGFGVAVYSLNEVGIKTGRENRLPVVWGKGYARNVFVAGYAGPADFILPGMVLGVNMRYIQRQRVSPFQVKAENLGDVNTLAESITDEFRVKRKTVAADVGVLKHVTSLNADVGVVLKSVGDGRGASLDAGISRRLLWNTVLVVVDYRDILDNNRENVAEKLHLGVEYAYDVFAVRAGLNEGRLTYGFGLNFKLLHIDCAVYTDESGSVADRYEDRRLIGQIRLGW